MDAMSDPRLRKILLDAAAESTVAKMSERELENLLAATEALLDSDVEARLRIARVVWLNSNHAKQRRRAAKLVQDLDGKEIAKALDLTGDNASRNWEVIAKLRRDGIAIDVSQAPLRLRMTPSDTKKPPTEGLSFMVLVALAGVAVIWAPLLLFYGMAGVVGEELVFAAIAAAGAATLAAAAASRAFRPASLSPDRLALLFADLWRSVIFGVVAALLLVGGQRWFFEGYLESFPWPALVITGIAFALVRPFGGLARGTASGKAARMSLTFVAGAAPGLALMIFGVGLADEPGRADFVLSLILGGPALVAVALAVAAREEALEDLAPMDTLWFRRLVGVALPLCAGSVAAVVFATVAGVEPSVRAPDAFVAENGDERLLLRINQPHQLDVAFRQLVALSLAVGSEARSLSLFRAGELRPLFSFGMGSSEEVMLEPGRHLLCADTEETCNPGLTPRTAASYLRGYAGSLEARLRGEPAEIASFPFKRFARVTITTDRDNLKGSIGVRNAVRDLITSPGASVGGRGYVVAAGPVWATFEGSRREVRRGSIFFREVDNRAIPIAGAAAPADAGAIVGAAAVTAAGWLPMQDNQLEGPGELTALTAQQVEENFEKLTAYHALASNPATDSHFTVGAMHAALSVGAKRLLRLLETTALPPRSAPIRGRFVFTEDGSTAGLFQTDPSAKVMRLRLGWSAFPNLDLCYETEASPGHPVDVDLSAGVPETWRIAIEELRVKLPTAPAAVSEAPALQVHPERCAPVSAEWRVDLGAWTPVTVAPGERMPIFVQSFELDDIVLFQRAVDDAADRGSERIDRDPETGAEQKGAERTDLFNPGSTPRRFELCAVAYGVAECAVAAGSRMGDTVTFQFDEAQFGNALSVETGWADTAAIAAYDTWLAEQHGGGATSVGCHISVNEIVSGETRVRRGALYSASPDQSELVPIFAVTDWAPVANGDASGRVRGQQVGKPQNESVAPPNAPRLFDRVAADWSVLGEEGINDTAGLLGRYAAAALRISTRNAEITVTNKLKSISAITVGERVSVEQDLAQGCGGTDSFMP